MLSLFTYGLTFGLAETTLDKKDSAPHAALQSSDKIPGTTVEQTPPDETLIGLQKRVNQLRKRKGEKA
jgi:hypothetical protein